jgi:tetratricopeptide (TPR) repeat protein
LARLFLGPRGGGPLAVGRAARLVSHDAGRKGIVDARGGRIEVASRCEFVGRRREIQTIRREFRQPEHAGVVIHGFGGQGKSSLAARIMDRHPDLIPVVLYQRCDGPSLLATIRDRVSEAAEICDRWHDRVDPTRPDYDPDALYHALRALFEGPCGYAGGGKPILLLLDDFEALLDAPVVEGHWRVKPDAAAPLAAIIRAFGRGGTDSRLLITSRYEFRLGEGDRDRAWRLLSVPLAETSVANRLKQARQKVVAMRRGGPGDLPPLTQRTIAAAHGNAGLQDLLFQVVLADPAAGEPAIQALESYLGGGALPEREELRTALEKLVIEKLLESLTEGERKLLGASTLFQLPLPLSVWEKFAERLGLGRPSRLLAFGLWERSPDIAYPHADAAGPNAIAAARLPSLPDEDAKHLIAAVLPDLFAAWGDKPASTCFELTRLALAGGNLDVVATTAPDAIHGLEQAFAYREAAATATAVLDALEAGGRAPEVGLLRAAAEVYYYVGSPDGLRRVYADASALVVDDPSQPTAARLDRAQFRARYGAYLQQLGEPDSALRELRAASAVFESLGDRRSWAVVLADTARIMLAKGDIDDALASHQEALEIFGTLGERRERGIVLGDIARIMTIKGQVDAALALHQEQLEIAEALGDRRGRAVVLGDIARIMRSKGDIGDALVLHEERLASFTALGDQRARATTLGDIARILRAKGDNDAALKLHQDELATYETLGDRRLRAMTLGEIARIMTDRGEVEAALALHHEQLEIFETLGDRRSLAITLGDVARILTAQGDVDSALALHKRQQEVFRAMGDRRGLAVVLGDIARIMTAKGDGGAALALHHEQREIFEALGDRRARAVVLGDIARIMTGRGEVEEALRLQRERLGVNRELGDQDGIASASYDIGHVQLFQAIEHSDSGAFQLSVDALTESYSILLKIGRLDGICAVGLALGQALAMAGEHDRARAILQRSLDGFRRLGESAHAQEIARLLAQMEQGDTTIHSGLK